MSLREKSAWACLAITVAVFIPYFAHVFSDFARGELQAKSVLIAFFLASAWQVLLHVVVQFVVAIRSRQQPKDERDRAIESKSFRHAYWIFAFAVWPVIMVEAGATSLHSLSTPAMICQLLFLCFVAAEITRYATQIACYRRGS
jgi:hypothetical protein